jgi:ABC-type phosphate/phosphonate transport system substrate-binding protein
MIAGLPMYARPENRAAHDVLWALIRDGLRTRNIAAPDALDHDIDHMDLWARDDLVLSHICNLPYRAQFRGQVTLIGASDYGLPDNAPGHYSSLFVVRADSPAATPAEMATARFACNGILSQSGYGAAQLWAQAHGFAFGDPLITGAHRASIAAVADGRADIATIDAQTWWIETQNNPDVRRLKVIGQTHNGPGMTFIARAGQDPKPYFEAITSAIGDLPKAQRDILNLRGIIAHPQSAYDLPQPPNLQAISA